jgi:hypothetical protein
MKLQASRMRKPRSALVLLLLLLVFGVSLAVPAEDVLETPYDESESMPYEKTPLFSIVVLEIVAAAATGLTCASPLCFGFSRLRYQCRRRSSAQLRHVNDSLTILDHSLRC